jgi:signal transduction histidine kinase/ligand-binding sensor domain-containing protein
MFKPVLYAIVLLLCLDAHAQIMPFKNYGIRDGLNDNNVQAVIRDDKGLLWVGTDFGISWFDGKRFYQPQLKTNIGQLYVTGFNKDRDGTIWVLSFFNGIFKYQNGRFTNYLIDKQLKDAGANYVSGMIQVSANKYIVIGDGSPYLFDGKSFSVFDAANPGLKRQTNSISQLPDGTILFSTDNGVFLYKLDDKGAKLIDHVLKTTQAIKILVTEKQLWALTSTGLLSFENSGADAFYNSPQNYLSQKKIRDLTADKYGDIWAFTDNGTMWALTDTLFKIKDRKITQYTGVNGLPQNIQQVYCDNEGLVWFANRKGISMLGDEHYEFNAIRNEKSDQPITSLILDSQNNLWVGAVNGMAVKKDNRYIFLSSAGKQTIGYVSWLRSYKKGSFLAGTTTGILNIKGIAITKQFNIHSTAVCTEKGEKAWYGDIDGNVWRDDGKALRPVKMAHPVTEMIVAMQYENNYLWVGYRDRGVVKYFVKNDSLLKVTEYSQATGYSDIRIRSCTTDKKGNIIWGTRTNGIFIFSTATGMPVAHITARNGLNANWVKDIYCDADGKLYLATNSGINIVWGNYKNPLVKQLKINNDNINRETNCILKTGDVFYIGTNEGILKWIPGNIRKDTVSPPVYFTQVNIQGLKNFSVDPYMVNTGNISLAYDQHFISFEFAGISLKNPENVRYHYILNGQDNEWSPITEHNFVAFDLKPGNYTFKVAAENADGVWSRRPAVFHFLIKPPFWQTWWFLILLALVIALLVYSAYRYQLSKMLALELLRNKISTDLHDDIGSTLSSISILSEVAARGDEKKSKRILGEINERSYQLMEKMDDIVWSISSKNDTVGNLFARIQQFAATVLEAKDIDYEVNVPERIKGIKLDMQRRQNIYLILKESINNLIKYSCCTKTCIEAGYENNLLRIEITDNGNGFDMKTIHYGNGLLNMKKRADAMKGTFLIVSTPGTGTRVILSVQIE